MPMNLKESKVKFWTPQKREEILNYVRTIDRPGRVTMHADFYKLEAIVQGANIRPDGLFQNKDVVFAGLCVPVERFKLLGGFGVFREFKPSYGRPNPAFWFPMPASHYATESIDVKSATYPKSLRLLFILECIKLVRETLNEDPRADEFGFGTY